MEVFECHLPYGVTQCYLLPDTVNIPRLNPSHASWYSIYLPRRDGRLDLVDLIAPRPGVELATFRSRDESNAQPLHHQDNYFLKIHVELAAKSVFRLGRYYIFWQGLPVQLVAYLLYIVTFIIAYIWIFSLHFVHTWSYKLFFLSIY